MTRNLIAFGLMLTALLLSGVAPAKVSAQAQFTATEYPVTLEGSSLEGEEHVFGLAGSEFGCEQAELTGEAPERSPTATLQPAFTSCTWSSYSATVGMNGCTYAFHLGANAEEMTVELVCPEGKAVTITTASGECEITISAQDFSSVQLTNETAAEPDGITLHFSVEDLSYTVVNSGFPCPLIAGSFENGTYSGSVTVVGINGEAEPVGIDAAVPPDPKITAGLGGGKLDGESIEGLILNRSARKIICNKAKFNGFVESGGSSTATLIPTYEECHSSMYPSAPTVVTMNGCQYLLHAKIVSKGYGSQWDLECPLGQQMEISVYSSHGNFTSKTAECKYTITPTVGGILGVLTNNKGSPNDFVANLSETGITSSSTGLVLICGPTSPAATGFGGITFTATNMEEVPIGVEVTG